MRERAADSLVYLTWDGPGAHYLRSLYLPIFARLPVPVEVVQVSYGDAHELEATAQMAAELGVGFRGRLFKRQAQTGATLAAGASALLAEAARAAWSGRRLVMARSLVPAAALLATMVPTNRFVFDADGLVADERVEFAGWRREGLPYRAARRIERRATERACVTVTRTRAARDTLIERARSRRGPVLVAANGTDEARFAPLSPERREQSRSALGLKQGDLLVVYCGTLGPQYRPDLMASFIHELRAREPSRRVHFRIVTPSREAGLSLARSVQDAESRSVSPEDVPAEIAPADLALALREPSFSQRAVAPIKVGEYLLCGVPVVANVGVGDLESTLAPQYAVMIEELTDASVRMAAARLQMPLLDRRAARSAGEEHFSLQVAVSGYAAAIAAARTRIQEET